MSGLQRERCVVCGREMDFDEPVSISETGLGGVCSDCSSIIDELYQAGVEGMIITYSSADALARKWAQGEVKPEDYDPRIKEWKSEQAVRQAVKEGELHQKQVQDELERRSRAGTFGEDTPAFVDHHPMPGFAEAKAERERKQRELDAKHEAMARARAEEDERIESTIRASNTPEELAEMGVQWLKERW